ncbi:hypothetical protein CBER1_08491 [Cercospora berteroae]|uniref:Serine aminopeptidase S33 domain-containing protein n=1 Tax=Cercospora berteroae TaxID=357750 RepID=A0A2S6BVU0_9PEZI|nr:hypothetical protein CBER1_08491 [Cercospora berteroae]
MGEAARSFFGHAIPPTEQIKSLEALAAQRTAEATGAAPVYIPFVPEKLEHIDEKTPSMLREGYDYYRTPRGEHPNSKGRFLMTSMGRMLTYSVFAQLPTLLTQPLPLIAGSEADTKFYSDQAYALSKGPKELFVVEGASHIALYDKPEYVDQAVNKLVSFFGQL